MATQITNKQVKIISDVNFNGKKIVGAEINSNDNNINININQFTGTFFPKNTTEFQDIITNNNSIIIDFSNFNGIWNSTGYSISGKKFIFKNLNITSEHQFSWFEQTLFTFTNCEITFINCDINIGNLEFDNLNEPAPLIICNATEVDNTSHVINFQNSVIDVYWITGISNITLIKLNNDKFSLKNCRFGLYGFYSNSTIIEMNIENTFTDEMHTRSEIHYSTLEMFNELMDNSCTCIRYTEDTPSRLTVLYSTILSFDDNSIILPNGLNMQLNYSAVENITCKEPDNTTFSLYNTETTYQQGDALKWVEHYPEAEVNPTVGNTYSAGQYIYYNDNMYQLREDSECVSPIQNWLDENADNTTNIQWLQVEAETLTTSDDYYDMWSYLDNGDLDHFYNTFIMGIMYSAYDHSNRIVRFSPGGTTRLNSLSSNSVEINGHLQSNNTNDFYIRMQDENINEGNDTDVLSAIHELATRPSGSSANLYDIKTLSQSIIDKGWACLSHTNRKDIAKADIPTMYAKIKEKYDNTDTVLSSSSDLNEQEVAIFVKGNYLYVVDTNKKLKRCSLTDIGSPVWTTLYDLGSMTLNNISLYVGENYIVVTYGAIVNSAYGVYGYILKLDGTLVDTISYPTNNQNYIDTAISYFDNCFYISVTKLVDGNAVYAVEKVEDIPTYTKTTVDENSDGYLRCIQKFNNKLFFVKSKQLYKSNLDFTNATQCYSSGSNLDVNGSFVIKGNTILTSRQASGTAMISTDGGETFSTSTSSNSSLLGLTLANGVAYGIKRNSTQLYASEDLSTWTLVSELAPNSSIANNSFSIMGNDAILIALFTSNSNLVRYCLYEKVVSTDTYVIDGNSVEIDYYESDGYKICIADGGTNDANLVKVYNYLGYYNYYVLDIENETLSLPRNSNLWTFMYVGDDYEDSNLPTGNTTRLLPQTEIITDNSASVSLDIQGNKTYDLTNSALTTLTINSCEDSPLGTLIKFHSGTTATTIDDTHDSGIDWTDGAAPIPSASKTCWILIVDKTGFYKEW